MTNVVEKLFARFRDSIDRKQFQKMKKILFEKARLCRNAKLSNRMRALGCMSKRELLGDFIEPYSSM